MDPAKKELKMLLVEVNDVLEDIERDAASLVYQKEKLGIEYYGKAVELRAQLLQGYALKAELLQKLYHI